MSTFEGRMLEYSFISLDRFDKDNLSSTMFFLSHTHFDHIHGLKEPEFLEVLEKRPSTYLYCSKMVKNILLKMSYYTHLEPHIKVLEVNTPTLIEVLNEDSSESTNTFITVTLLQAGHCLGSVMFLIEGSEGTVLYTGDFRWEENEFLRMTWLKSGDNLKLIKSLYVDTTFCIPETLHIPTRTESYEAVLSEVTKHFRKCDDNYVCIFSKTNFGYEHLLEKLAKAFKTKVHVDEFKKSVYDTIPKLKDVFTTSTENARIHFHKTEYCSELRQQRFKYMRENSEKLVIKVSVMWFMEGSRRKNHADALEWVRPNVCRVCYSCHPSYEEVEALIKYLKPQNVFPNVCPKYYSLEQIQIKLNEFLDKPIPETQQQQCSSEDKQLGTMKFKKVPEISYPPRESVSFTDSDSQQSQLSVSQNSCNNENMSSSRNLQREGSENVTLPTCSVQKNMSTSSCDVQGAKHDSVLSRCSGTLRDMSEERTSHYTKLRDESKDKLSLYCNTYKEMSNGMTSQSYNSDEPSQQRNSHEENLESVTSNHCNVQSQSLENMSPQNSNPCEFSLFTMAAEQRKDNVSPKCKSNEIGLTDTSPKPISSNQGNRSPKYTDSNKDILTMKSSKHKENKEKLFDIPLEKSENYENCHEISQKNYSEEQNEVKEIRNQEGNPNQSIVLDEKEKVPDKRDSKIICKDQLVNLSQIFGSLKYLGGDSNQIGPVSKQQVLLETTDSNKNIENTELNVDISHDCNSDGKSEGISLKDGPLSNNSRDSSFGYSFCKITEKSKRMSEISPNTNKFKVQSSTLSDGTKSFPPVMNNEVTSTLSVDDDDNNNNNTINESLQSETNCSTSEGSAEANNTRKICCMSKAKIPTDKTVSQSIPAAPQQILGKRKQETAASCENTCSNYKKFCDIPLVDDESSRSIVLENCSEVAKQTSGEYTTYKHQQKRLESVEEKNVECILENQYCPSKHRINLNSTTLAQSTSMDESQNNAHVEVLCKSSADNLPKEKSSSQSTIVLSDSQNSEWDPDRENKNSSESQETLPPSPFSISSNSQPLLSPQTLDRMSIVDHCNINNLPSVNCQNDIANPCSSPNQDDVVFVEKKVLRYVID